MKPLTRAGALLLLGTVPPLAYAEPDRGLDCRHAFDTTRTSPAVRLEMMVELAFDALNTRDIRLPANAVQRGLLGVVVEDVCRRDPATPLRQAVDFAVRVAADAHPVGPVRVAAGR